MHDKEGRFVLVFVVLPLWTWLALTCSTGHGLFSFLVNAYVDESSGSERRHKLLQRSLHDHFYSHFIDGNSNNVEDDIDDDGDDGVSSTELNPNDDSTSTSTTTTANNNNNNNANSLNISEAAEMAYLTYFYTSYRAQESPHVKTDRSASLHDAFAVFPPSRRQANLQLIKDMFQHAWDSYLLYAFPHHELKPMSCQGYEFDLVKLPALTMIDSLDMLLILGNYTEFVRSLERVRLLYHDQKDDSDPTSSSSSSTTTNKKGAFAIDQNVSVFETNIRVLGGLLSAHQLAMAYLNNDSHHDATDGGKVLKHDVFDENGRIRMGPVISRTSLNKERQEQQQLQTSTTTDGNDKLIDNHNENDNDNSNDVTFQQQQGSPDSNDPLQSSSASSSCTWWAGGSSFYEDVIVTSWFSAMNQQQQEKNQHDNESWRQQAIENELHDTNGEVANEEEAHSLFDVCANIRPYGSRVGYNASKATSTTSTNAESSQFPSSSQQQEHYHYDGFLLDMALDLGNRLLPAFETPTGIPYGTVNLLHGVPHGETPVASLAGGGTVSLEFHLLSRLTGDDRFAKAAKLATRALFLRQSIIGLFGKHIDVRRGHWTETLSGIGSNSDSFLEYLVKHYFLFPSDSDFWSMLVSSYSGVFNHSREGEWYVDSDMSTGMHRGHYRRVLESLMAFYPGMQVLLGEITPAARSANSFFLVREWLGFLPERFSYPAWRADVGRGAAKHPLRPELLESGYFLHRATRGMYAHATTTAPTSGWLWAQDFALHQLEKTTKVACGYAGVSSLDPATSGHVDSAATPSNIHLMDEMPSFFLSETLKYLYLTFDEDNVLHRDDNRDWIFTTEAHPIHYVAKKSKRTSHHSHNENDAPKPSHERFAAEREILKDLLRERLRKRTHRRSDSVDNALKGESWSEKTTLKGYKAKLHATNKEVAAALAELHKSSNEQQNSGNSSDHFFDDRRLVAPFVSDTFSPSDFGNDLRQNSNMAHLAPTNLGIGQGVHLKRACPNFYSSDLLWLHALNGGAFDYSEIYVSVSRDTLEDHPIEFLVLGSAEALGIHGTGVYPGDKEKYPSCPVPHASGESTAGSKNPSKSEANDSKSRLGGRGEVIQIQSEFGLFEVMPEPDGSGFYIHLVETAETLITTFFDGFAMIYSSRPTAAAHSEMVAAQATSKSQSPWRRMGSRLKSILSSGSSSSAFGRSRGDEALGTPEVPTDRRVVLADYEGNMFSCEVEVFETFPDEENPDKQYRRDVEVMLATFPCAPARFGLTEVQRLARSGGITIQAEGVPPQQGDEKGCMRVPVDESLDEFQEIPTVASDTTKPIQIVRRGDCSFYSKAVNQRMLRNAGGMIVINDSDYDVFVMTAGEQGEVLLEPEQVPVSVLMTGLDGEELLEKLAVDKDDDEAKVGVRISITRQPNSLGLAADVGDMYWPIVVGSSGMLNVYVQGGWGIQATKRSGRSDWQLQLLRSEPIP